MLKNDNISSAFSLPLEILRRLAERPYGRRELCIALEDRFDPDGSGDLAQRITRTISRLRACGFQISSAPSQAYVLEVSTFPVILSQQQRQALTLATQVLSELGFTNQAALLKGLEHQSSPNNSLPATCLNTNFHPPVNYSDPGLATKVETLQARLKHRHRFVIRYRDSQGSTAQWDIDLAELRLHDGILYLFAYVPTPPIVLSDPASPIQRNFAFRVDRIEDINPPSSAPWHRMGFPTLAVQYRLLGPLRDYQPRRDHERIIKRGENWVDIETHEDSLFWLQQRILRYGANAIVLSPEWLKDRFTSIFHSACQIYEGYRP